MRSIIAIVLSAIVCAHAEDSIRSFSIPQLEALGQELYHRDLMAATATDTLLAARPKVRDLPMRGWITQHGKEHRRVYFILEQDSHPSLAYVINFGDEGNPTVEDQLGRELPDFVAKRYSARNAATKAITKFMTKNYNFEVLDAPDGQGYLVYALAATKNSKEVVVGGHYRVSVAADGEKVTRVDALSRSFLVLPKQAEQAREANVVGLTMTHSVSNTPVETHVYLSLLHKLPFYVLTPDKVIWRIKEGKIVQIGVSP